MFNRNANGVRTAVIVAATRKNAHADGIEVKQRGVRSMIHGYHVIIVTYGSWLPNDPRGSWSEFVAAWELYRFGRVPRAPARILNSQFNESKFNDR